MCGQSEPKINGLASAIDALTTAIQAEPSFQQWRAAAEAFERDPELTELLKRYNKLTNSWQQRGEDDPELTELADQIQGHRLFHERTFAMESMTRLLQEVNGTLSDGLGLDFATVAAKRSGCCG